MSDTLRMQIFNTKEDFKYKFLDSAYSELSLLIFEIIFKVTLIAILIDHA